MSRCLPSLARLHRAPPVGERKPRPRSPPPSSAQGRPTQLARDGARRRHRRTPGRPARDAGLSRAQVLDPTELNRGLRDIVICLQGVNLAWLREAPGEPPKTDSAWPRPAKAGLAAASPGQG